MQVRVSSCLSGFALALLLVAALPAIAQPVAGSVPTDAELEARGAVIGRILIRNGDVFDLDDPAEDKSLYRLANRLHKRTRPHVIRGFLLFSRGDRYERRLLEESARILRGLRYLGDASIEPVAWADGKVDIEVKTRDVWSLNPGVSFGRRGGRNHVGFELQELNLFGTGIELDLDHDSNVDRTTNSIGFEDRQAWGPHTTLELRYAHNSDGDGWTVGFERPFYALDSRQAAGIRYDVNDQISSLYSLGDEVERYRQRSDVGELFWGRSGGLDNGIVRRWTVGVSRERQRFAAAPDGFGTGLLPHDRDLLYPWIGFEFVQDAFDVWANRDQIGRTEDVLLGTRFSARIGRAAQSLGSDRDAWIFRAEAERSFALGREETLRVNGALSGRRERGDYADLRVDGSARYYHPLSERNLLFARAEASWGRNLDLDQTLLLGGDNGLRGYPLRYQGGDRRALFSVEQRYYTDWYPFRLFRVGAAVFADVGRTWGDDGLGTPNYGWMKDIGIGLRLGNTRSALGNVIHVDLAFPLDGPSDIDRVQLLIEAQREF